MNISWIPSTKTAAITCLAASLLLAGCGENSWNLLQELVFTAGQPGPNGQIWVSDNAVSTWTVPDTTSSPMNVAPNAASMTYWQQGLNPELAAETQACAPIPDYCGYLFYTNAGKLYVMNASAPGSTPTAAQIPTQYTVGNVAWSGQGGSNLYVTYPNNAAVGVIGGVSKTEHIANVIPLPGTTPSAIAMGRTSAYRYIISGNPPGAQQVVAFNDNGPISGFATPAVSFATSLAANGTYVGVVVTGKLLVYRSDLSVWGTVSTGLPNPYSVVIDQNSNMAYVTSLSAPNIPGQINAVNLDTLSVVGPTVTVGTGPFNTRLSWDGSVAFVANQNDGPPGTVSVLSAGPSGLALLRTVKVGTKPGAIAIHP